jgi:hypothetical protein
MVFLPVVRSYSLGLDFFNAAIMSAFVKEVEFGKKLEFKKKSKLKITVSPALAPFPGQVLGFFIGVQVLPFL